MEGGTRETRTQRLQWGDSPSITGQGVWRISGDQDHEQSPHIFSFSVRETCFLDLELMGMRQRNKILEVRKGETPNSRALGNGGVRIRRER